MGVIGLVREWYKGKEYNISTRDFPIHPGMRYKRHWTSEAAHYLVKFYLKEWKTFWTFLLALLAIAVKFYT
jgi:hypothetical protein